MRVDSLPHMKWKETKQHPIMLPGPAAPGCCLVSFRILWAILSTSTVDISGWSQGWCISNALWHMCVNDTCKSMSKHYQNRDQTVWRMFGHSEFPSCVLILRGVKLKMCGRSVQVRSGNLIAKFRGKEHDLDLAKARTEPQNVDRRTRTKIQALYLKNHKKYL